MAGQQQQGDSSNDLLYVGVFFLILYVILISFFGESIAKYHLMLRGWWADLGNFLLPWKPFAEMSQALDTYSPREWLESGKIDRVSQDLRWFMFIPLGGLFGFYAYRVWSKNPTQGLRRKMDREKLVKSEVRLWPWIAPVQGLDLVATPIDEGKWAMARTPVDFAKRYRLMNGREVHEVRTEKFFASQLGKLWEGPEKLPSHLRALFACFIAQACRDKDGARDGLRALALTVHTGKPDYSFVDGLLKKHINDKRIAQVFEQHAYVITVLCGVLDLARKNGVLPPAYFLWLRPLNRPVWYALNNLGRRTPFCETAGVHAHFLAEKVAKHRLERPYVTEAVKALGKALREYKFD
jgi:intracellular multiplication protein IcmP